MFTFLEGLLLALVGLTVVGTQAVTEQSLETRQEESDSNATAAPVVFTPDQNWDGIDGRWSSFTLRVGTPQQFVRVFISWAAYQTWVIIPEGCVNAIDYDACEDDRGWIFDEAESSTWEEQGIYRLGLQRNLGYDSNGIFGYDRVGLGGIGEGGPAIENTTIGGIATDIYYLGLFGLHPKPTNFTTFNEGIPSYMTLMKEQKIIPSISFGYTAGAHYRYSVGVYASLTLGGYDQSKFIENGVEWTFAPDNERDIVVAIQQITTPSTIEANPQAILLLPEPIYAYIDATVPEIWLPENACQAFESAFGLEYNEELDVYAVNDTLHETLQERNANVTFALAESFDGGPSVDIILPYAAFDLTARPPYASVTNSTRYFPLRRAANSTQYTLGRTFMQEAYITVNWETFRFNVSQVDWTQNAEPNIKALPSFENARAAAEGAREDMDSSDGISAGAIAGIVIGVIAVLFIVAALFWLLRHKRRRRSSGEQLDEKAASDTNSQIQGNESNVVPKAELQGSEAFHPPVSYYDPDVKAWVTSPAGSTPSSPYPGSIARGFFPGSTIAGSPITSTAGEGTCSSSQTGYTNAQSPTSATASEADGKAIQVFEMPGDMPAIREMDGKQLSEKEALQHREKVYNGVDSTPPASAVEERPRDAGRLIDPEHVVRAGSGTLDGSTIAGSPTTADGGTSLTRQHRAFSFEADERERENYTQSNVQ